MHDVKENLKITNISNFALFLNLEEENKFNDKEIYQKYFDVHRILILFFTKFTSIMIINLNIYLISSLITTI